MPQPAPEDQLTIDDAAVVEPPAEPEVVEAEVVDDDAADLETAEPLTTPTGHLGPVRPEEDTGSALMAIIGQAVDSGKAIDVIERLLAVHERVEANEARRQYNAAIAALRGELPRVVKTEEVDYKAKGGTVNYRHENLANMVEDLGPVMAKFGLSFRWKTDASVPQSISVTCIVTHAAGHSEEAVLFGPPDTSGSKNAIQAIASTVSYLQRYTLKAAIGLAAGKDDDGAGGAPSPPAGGHEPIEQPRATNGAEAGPGDGAEISELHEARSLFPADTSSKITANQIGRLRNLAKKNGWTNAAVDETLARVLCLPPSEIPSIGDAYESIVRWFQTNKPSA